ncbi:short-chain dehydrogenase/reductase [Bacillus sp. B-jedd]|nr:short-chain dehydrogenase/reductase [Bacillus sp. B-jedd]
MMFTGKTVVITGAGNGIGKGIAKEFAAKGAVVVIADIDEDAGRLLEAELLGLKTKAMFIPTDVKDETSVQSLFTEAASRFGKVDILVNNAGISEFHAFFEMTVDVWDKILDTNLRSVFLCSQAAGRIMKTTGGAIINIASTRARMSEPDTEAYSASKGGIVSLTHALARTLGPYNITVNCISPGWIETGDYEMLSAADHSQHISGRVGKPDDIARACLFLADSRNNFITGENIIIDGGMTKKMIYVD